MEQRTCSRCDASKPESDFGHRPDGTRNGSRCKACLTEVRCLERAARPPKPPSFRDRDRTSKVCNVCGVEKPVSEFYWNVRKWGSQCRPCRLVADRVARHARRPPRPPRQEAAKPARPTFAEHVWATVERHDIDDCWPWRGYVMPSGYAPIRLGVLAGRATPMRTTAHRVVYELAVGPIPDGFDIDHLCHTEACTLGTECPHRRCCNPRHLKAVPPVENKSRTNRPSKPRPLKTHCAKGHTYDAENTHVRPNGHRVCRECNRLNQGGRPTREHKYVPKPRSIHVTC